MRLWLLLPLFSAAIVVALAITALWSVSHISYAANDLPSRSLTLSDSEPLASGVEYDFVFTIDVSGTLGSIEFEFCENDPFVGTSCIAPTGLDNSAASFSGFSGISDFSLHTDTFLSSNRLILTRTPGLISAPQPVSFNFSGMVNPDITNGTPSQTYYVRMSLYDVADPDVNDDGVIDNVDITTGPVTRYATGGIAFNVNDLFNVTTEVPPFLLFCTGLSISGTDCTTSQGSYISFGTLSSAQANTAISQMVAATNADSGYNISVHGTSLTSGNNVISANNNRSVSITGTGQFGLNLRLNNSPAVGQDPSGPGTAVPAANYNSINEFTFNNNDVIATSTGTNDYRKFTASYLVNVAASQATGKYTATLSYVCLATF